MDAPMLAADAIAFEYENHESTSVCFDDVSVHVSPGEIVGLVGRSGAGKSTLARIMAGLLSPREGKVACDGTEVSQPDSPVAYVAQDYRRAILPWLTVERNIELGRHMTPRMLDATSGVQTIAAELGISDELLGKHPPRLSGGQIQRVQIGRALFAAPRYMIFDEPTTSLDLEFRQSFQKILLRIVRQRNIGVLLVTHEVDDAVLLSRRLYLMKKSAAGAASIREEQGYGVENEARVTAMCTRRFGEIRQCVHHALFDF